MTTATKQTDSKTLALHRAVYAARTQAREAMTTCRLASNFIAATQEYQVSLLSVAATKPDYWSARADFARAVEDDKLSLRLAEAALVHSEDELCCASPKLQEKRDAMLLTGKAYMKSNPELALMLDLPAAERAWNHVKLLLKR